MALRSITKRQAAEGNDEPKMVTSLTFVASTLWSVFFEALATILANGIAFGTSSMRTAFRQLATMRFDFRVELQHDVHVRQHGRSSARDRALQFGA